MEYEKKENLEIKGEVHARETFFVWFFFNVILMNVYFLQKNFTLMKQNK